MGIQTGKNRGQSPGFLLSGSTAGQWTNPSIQHCFYSCDKVLGTQRPSGLCVTAKGCDCTFWQTFQQCSLPFPGVLNVLPPIEIQKTACVRSPNVGRRTGPRVIPWVGFHACPHRILFDVAKCIHEVNIIHGTGKESVLPQMASVVMETIENLRVPKMGSSNGFLEAVCCFGYGNNVNVVGHEAVAQDGQLMTFAFFFQQSEVGRSVLVV